MKRLLLLLLIIPLFTISCDKDEEIHEDFKEITKCMGCKQDRQLIDNRLVKK